MTCSNPKCLFGHPTGWISTQESTPVHVHAPRPQSNGKTEQKKFVGKVINGLAMKHLAIVEGKQTALCITLMTSQDEAEKQKQFNQVKKALMFLENDFGPVFAQYQKILEIQKALEANNSKLLSSSASNPSDTSSRDEEDVEKMFNELVLDNPVHVSVPESEAPTPTLD